MPKQRGKPASKSANSVRNPQPPIIIITGLSGSGKATVLKSLEDLGYYAVDNLPIDLIPKFAELSRSVQPGKRGAAITVDIREGESLRRFPALYRKLKRELPITLVFMEAADEALVRRFSETRRPHPLGRKNSVLQSLKHEREELNPIRALADHIIDTSKFTVHELRDIISETFEGTAPGENIMINVISFGFRHGVPNDSDLVFDVRFLPNPNYIPEFKHLTGKHPRVARYIRSFPQTVEFIDRISELLIYLLPHYKREGKSYLSIGFGCTGGHHRSVMMASEIRKRLSKAGYRAKETHRDVTKG